MRGCGENGGKSEQHARILFVRDLNQQWPSWSTKFFFVFSSKCLLNFPICKISLKISADLLPKFLQNFSEQSRNRTKILNVDFKFYWQFFYTLQLLKSLQIVPEICLVSVSISSFLLLYFMSLIPVSFPILVIRIFNRLRSRRVVMFCVYIYVCVYIYIYIYIYSHGQK